MTRSPDALPPLLTAGVDGGTFRLRRPRQGDLPGISRRGAQRSHIEGVRVAAHLRGKGIGNQLMQWAIGESRRHGCSLMQLTTHTSRAAAHRFYERFGFEASHEGMKLPL